MMGIQQELHTGVFGNQEEVQHLSSRFLLTELLNMQSQLSGLEQEKAGLSGTESRVFLLLDRRLAIDKPDAKASYLWSFCDCFASHCFALF